MTNITLVVTNIPPWMQRASDIKAELVINHELEHKLQQHNEEIIKLIKDLKLKVKTKGGEKRKSDIDILIGPSTSRSRCQD